MTKQRILLYFSLIAVVALNLYFRSFPVYFPQLKIQAKDIIEKSIQQMAAREVQQKFPQFYPTAKDEIVRARIAEYKKQNKKIIQSQIQSLYHQLKDKYQDEHGQTYLMELDCWHWGRYVDNVVNLGHPGDEVIGGRQWDLFMLAPSGFFINWEHFLFYTSAFLYKVFCIFNPVPLFNFLFYLPLFFTWAFIGALFLFCFRYGKVIGAITTCLFVGLAPIFLPRSCAGWFDMDILNLLFPLLVTWTYVTGSCSRSLKYRLLWICFSGFWVGLFCYTWTQWWFIFLIIIIYEFIYLVYLLFAEFCLKRGKPDLLKLHSISLAAFISFGFFWILILAGAEPFEALYAAIKDALTLNKPLMSSIWPNVYATVGELRGASLLEVANAAGGMWIFTAALMSILILCIRALLGKIKVEEKRIAILILSIWFIAMFFASSRGVRFAVFLLIPLGVSLGWMMNDTYEYFRNRKIKLGVYFILLILGVFCGSIAKKGLRAAEGIYPLMDDTWYKVLNIIKEKTPQNTILNSWWDFGDWFKVVARRKVIFDGQTQHGPQAYWMAKALLTDNEYEAANILRMLNNGGNKAFEIIDEHLKDPLLSVLLLENVLLLPPERGKEILQKFLPSPVVESLSNLLARNPARADFVVDHTMPYKMPAISYLGNWDFSKVYIAQNFDNKEKDKIIERLKDLGRNEQEIQLFYQEAFLISTKRLNEWLSRRLQFYGPLANGHEKDGIVFFDNGFAYNPKERSLHSNSNQIPRSLFVQDGEDLIEITYPQANSIFSILVFKTEEGYKSILLDPALGRSMFVRLYFLNGAGLKHFLPFVDAQEGNNYIRVFDILW